MATRIGTNSVSKVHVHFGRVRRARRFVVTNACDREADVKRAIQDRLMTMDLSLRRISLLALKECVPSEHCATQPECLRLMRSLITIVENMDALRKEIDI